MAAQQNKIADNVPALTPQKHPFAVPTKALAEAIANEWQAGAKYSVAKMPLTALAYTAIDQIAGQKDTIVEVLMAYIDTDTLSYRATGSEALATQQLEQWNPILAWAGKRFGATWQVTTGVMPLEQPQALHQAVQKYLQKLNEMQLAACCVLGSCLSSLVLAVAVLEKHVNAVEAFRLSRLEEEAQAAAWGRDSEADQRAERLKREIVSAAEFLGLLEAR